MPLKPVIEERKMSRNAYEPKFADIETAEDKVMWNLTDRKFAHIHGWEITPWRKMSNGVVYIVGWTDFVAPGDTVVEYIEAYMDVSHPVYERAWQFYCALQLGGRVKFKR